jgi:hypothetical protein
MSEDDAGKLIKQEALVKEKIDDKGERWIKKYVGGGTHFFNWLTQFIEVYGEENVKTEEIDHRGYSCFENEKMFRIWVKEPI